MKKLLLFLLVASATLLMAAPRAQQPAAESSDIRLVVLIAVDQFRHDYLTRFRSDYTAGVKRLLTGGAVFTSAYLEHYPTVTAVGHATMLSGATPSTSGIIGNDWFDRESGLSVASITDATVKPVGAHDAATASPRRLLVSTLGDEMKLASAAPRGSPEAPRVIGMSLKDRSAILSVGRGADAAYWFDTRTGSFVTSTYYMNDVPAWVRAFNDRRPADARAGQAWVPLFAPQPVLRQLPTEKDATLYDAVYGSAFGNQMLLDLATTALAEERLGQRGVTDLLSVSFSANDPVGHTHGPDSPHVRDISIRTDRAIGQLLDRVDRLVGLEHTIVALTADHGVAPLPESLAAQSLPGGRMTNKELFGPMEAALAARFGPGKWLLATAGSSPYLNHALIDERRLDAVEVRRVAAAAVMAVPHVARVYTRDQLLHAEVPDDLIGRRVLRGFHAPRSGDLEVILDPYWLRQATGTTHGSPYNYDAHIPLILMGRFVTPGTYPGPVALNDLAPTLAALIDVDAPSASSGRVLTEALSPRSRR